ncbi:MAG: redox-sensing transcriptional repressor Rex [Bacteroidales bacterium]|nr:redox-sensing transcriptional repressor Rex [Bacteroidales bacterium]
MLNKNLPERTVARLSEYRRTLFDLLSKGRTHIYSHDLASLHNITAVQVRRDLMLIGYSSILRKGYDIKELIGIIGEILDTENGQNVAVIGIGNLGRAITAYFNGKRPKLNIVATFDIDPDKVNKVISGVFCYHMNDIEEVVKKNKITIGIITVPLEQANEVAEKLVLSGIKGILNFTSAFLNVPSQVYLDEYDMITSLEKVAFFVKANNPG